MTNAMTFYLTDKPILDLSPNTSLQRLQLSFGTSNSYVGGAIPHTHLCIPSLINILSHISAPTSLTSLDLSFYLDCPGTDTSLRPGFAKRTFHPIDECLAILVERHPKLNSIRLTVRTNHQGCYGTVGMFEAPIYCEVWDALKNENEEAKTVREDWFPFLGLHKPKELEVEFRGELYNLRYD